MYVLLEPFRKQILSLKIDTQQSDKNKIKYNLDPPQAHQLNVHE